MRLIIILLVLFPAVLSAQNNALIIQDGAVINITNGAALIVDQPNTNGIVKTGTATGYINSEGETNRVFWRLSTATGSFVIPFGDNNAVQIPFTYQVTAAATGAGFIQASTYRTINNNTGYPSVYVPTVFTMNADYTYGDRSLYAADRFWVLRSSGFATNPSSTLTFTYDETNGEIGGTNTITEANLQAQYWNTNQWSPGWYSAAPLLGTCTPASNLVSGVNSATNGNFYTWVLVDNTHPLPVELISLNASCNQGLNTIEWTTATETNCDYFSIERSFDANTWEWMATVSASGNSNTPLHYFYTDPETHTSTVYYRLSQTDFDGSNVILQTVESNCNGNIATNNNYNFNVFSDQEHQIFANFICDSDEKVIIKVLDVRGRLVHLQEIDAFSGENAVCIQMTPLAEAIYLVVLQTANVYESKKLLLQ